MVAFLIIFAVVASIIGAAALGWGVDSRELGLR